MTEPPKNGHNPNKDSLGRFVKGNTASAGNGRPPGSLDFMKLVREKSQAEGLDFSELMWNVVKRMASDAMKGNTLAGKILIDRVFGSEKLNIEMSAPKAGETEGPQLPHNPAELRQYLSDIVDLVDGPVIDVLPLKHREKPNDE